MWQSAPLWSHASPVLSQFGMGKNFPNGVKKWQFGSVNVYHLNFVGWGAIIFQIVAKFCNFADEKE